MKAKEKVVSSITAVLLVAALCATSYMLGAKRSADIKTGNMELQNLDSGIDAAPDSSPVAHPTSPAEVEAVSVADDGADAGGKQDDIAAEQRERMMRNIADNLAMPGMNKMIQQQQRVLMADKYRGLIKTLWLNPKEEAYLMDLLSARQMLQAQIVETWGIQEFLESLVALRFAAMYL